MRSSGNFPCSDPPTNRLQKNMVWSLRGNMVSLPIDCPQREAAGNGDDLVFQRLPQHLQRLLHKLGQLVQKQHAPARQRPLSY